MLGDELWLSSEDAGKCAVKLLGGILSTPEPGWLRKACERYVPA